jgi:serine/threonine-protein kinase
LQPAPAPLGPGATLELGHARVVVEQRLGEGAMGVVWRGWLFYAPTGPRGSEPPIPVAIKQLRPQAHSNAQMRQFFLNEAEAMRRLAHPNVVRFHELFEAGGSLALAMEYVDGDTLEDVISRHVARARLAGARSLPAMPFRRAWYYFQQLLGALAATHALGIVHRDVKPSNILIRRDGIVKLSDYGIARLARPDGLPGAATQAGLAPGTGPYMSPEAVLGRPLDGRSDLYAAAIVLYEMLAGRPPFTTEDKSEFAVRMEQVEHQPPPIRTFLCQAPPILEALFARALAKDPALRFASALEMGESFRMALGLPDTEEWRAQREIAHIAPRPRSKGQTQRMKTLREALEHRYKTLAVQVR